MPMAVFHNLAKSLSRIDYLVLNGIGEPLLHPDLEEMITIARSTMPATGRIGFQSNGLLLNQARAVGLLKAGLDIISLLIWLTVSMEIYCPLILSFCSQERGRFYDGRSC